MYQHYDKIDESTESDFSKSNDIDSIKMSSASFKSGNQSTSMTGKWFDSGICVDSMSSVSSGLSLTSDSIRNRSNDLIDDNLLIPPPPETEPQDIRLIQQLRNESLHTFLPDSDGDTMLHCAALKGKVQLAFALISNCWHPDLLDIRNNLNETALHIACASGETKLVRRLVIAGASLDLQDAAGRTALLIACETGDLMLVRQLLSPIHSKEIEAADLKYSVTTHTQLKRLLSIRNYEGETCLHVAAKSGSVELIKYLVDHGADINAVELRGGNTLLHWAVAGQQIDLIQFLIERCEATLNVFNYAQQTPMRLAWDALRSRPGSKRIIIMLHLLREKGGEPRLLPASMSDSELSDMSSDSSDDSSDSE